MKHIFVFWLLLMSRVVIAQITDLFSIQAFQDGNFGGASQSFKPANQNEPGVYQANMGQLNILGNDQLTGLKVPFGLSVDLFETEDEKYQKMNYQPGLYPFVPEKFNDKVSKITVYPWTDIYLSTDDDIVPSKVNVFGGNYTSTTDGTNKSVSFIIDISNSDNKYYKRVQYDIPDGYTVKVWEATGNGVKEGRAGWDHRIEGKKLFVNVWVKVRDVAGARNWIGVRASLVRL